MMASFYQWLVPRMFCGYGIVTSFRQRMMGWFQSFHAQGFGKTSKLIHIVLLYTSCCYTHRAVIRIALLYASRCYAHRAVMHIALLCTSWSFNQEDTKKPPHASPVIISFSPRRSARDQLNPYERNPVGKRVKRWVVLIKIVTLVLAPTASASLRLRRSVEYKNQSPE